MQRLVSLAPAWSIADLQLGLFARSVVHRDREQHNDSMIPKQAKLACCFRGSYDGTTKFWSISTGRCWRSLKQEGPVMSVAVSSDGRQRRACLVKLMLHVQRLADG